MKKLIYPFNTKQKPKLSKVGGKGLSLILSSQKGLPVPDGFVMTVEFFQDWLKKTEHMKEWRNAIKASDKNRKKYLDDVKKKAMRFKFTKIQSDKLKKAMNGFKGKLMAIRSSSPEEDLEGASFAGGYETSLGVTKKTLERAIKKSFVSCLDERIYVYKNEHGFNASKPSIAVIVQEQIASDVSGVAFSTNPLNNSRDEAVINANLGLGETVVSGQVTPDTFIVNKTKNKLIKDIIGEKSHALWLKKDGGTRKQNIKDPKKPSLTKKQVAEVAELVKNVEAFYEKPMDIEWAYTGKNLYLLQARPITAFQPEWEIDDPKAMYARASIAELLPDPLSPLFATMASRRITRALSRLAKNLLKTDLLSEKTMNFVTINGYGYYKFKMRSLDYLKMMVFSWGPMVKLLKNAIKIWEEKNRPRFINIIKKHEKQDLKKLKSVELFKKANELTEESMTYYTTIQSALPIIYMSESILMKFYNKLIKRKDEPPHQVFVMGYDSTPIKADKSLFDLADWSKGKKGLSAFLLKSPAKKAMDLIERKDSPSAVPENEWKDWQKLFRKHLKVYGHTIYDLDFSKSVPADDPTPLFQAMKFYMQGKGNNPYKRQKEMADNREKWSEKIIKRLGFIRRRIFIKLLRWAQKNAPLREDGLAEVGLAWPFTRKIFAELGQRFVNAGVILEKNDIYNLKESGLRNISKKLDEGKNIKTMHQTIAKRQAEWKKQRKMTPPPLLPKNARFLGIRLASMMPAMTEDTKADKITGVGASQGQITGTARVILGPTEFGQMKAGDILVTAITTPAWTPLFALASGIVTDVGGPLSHSSIVAREYGIPAVLGTGMGSRRIKSGQKIKVDGDTGIVYLL